MSPEKSPIACDMSALTEEEQAAHEAVTGQLFQAVEAVEELPDGMALRLPPRTELLEAGARFIAYERLCCPFLDFELQVKREGGPLRLCLTGREGVKDYLQQELAPLIQDDPKP